VLYLSLAELLHIAGRTLGSEAAVRDHGLLQSALARPPASAFGGDACRSLDEKAAALMHSLARNHALVDGNKRLALAATIAFLGINGVRLTLTNGSAGFVSGQPPSTPIVSRRRRMVASSRKGARPWAAIIWTRVTSAAEYALDAACRSTSEKCHDLGVTFRQ